MTRIATFTVRGIPRTKKTSNRIVQIRGKAGARGFTKILPSKAFEEWNVAAQLQLRMAVARSLAPSGTFPIIQPVNCRALFYRDADRGDACGFYQALADAMQEAGIVKNDSQVRSWNGSRLLKDTANPRVEFELEGLEYVHLGLFPEAS